MPACWSWTASTPWWSAAARWADGPRSCSPKPADRSCWSRRDTLGSRREQQGCRHGARAGRHGDRDPTRACSAGAFYSEQRGRFPLDSGFVAQGYLMPCFTAEQVQAAHERIALQRSLGLDVDWLDPDEVDARATGLAPGCTLGASYAAGDGYLDAPRNVLAYTAALVAFGVDVREHTSFTGLLVEGDAVVGVETTDGRHRHRRRSCSPADRISPRSVGRPAARVHAGGTRHQVVVTAPLPGADRAADGVRRRLGHLLAPGRRRRAAVGHEQSGRAARPRARVRLRATTP